MAQKLLHTELKSRLAEGFIGAGNLAIGSFIFSQFLGSTKPNFIAGVVGFLLGLFFYFLAIIIFKEE